MKLSSCPRCERHVLVEASSCPFCGTRLGTTSALGRAMMIAVVGLSMSCGGDDSTETTVGATQGDPTQGSGVDTGTTSVENQTDSGGADYAGPGTEEGPLPDDTTGDTTSGGSSSSSGGETDTGDSSSGTPATDSGGADYAGAGPS